MTEDLLLRAGGVVVLLALASVGWWFATRRRGEVRPARALRSPGISRAGSARAGGAGDHRDTRLPQRTLARVLEVAAFTPGTGATVVQISSEYCSPCRRSAGLWSEFAASEPALSFVEVDGGEHLDLTREFGVLSTPTSLLFDSAGAFVGRIGGAPSRAQASRALQRLIEGSATEGSATEGSATEGSTAEGNLGEGALRNSTTHPGTASAATPDQIGAPR